MKMLILVLINFYKKKIYYLIPSLLHTTLLGKERIKRNIGLDVDDVIAWCKKQRPQYERRGKNFYVYAPDFVLTINAKSHTIITAHKINKKLKNLLQFLDICI